jgi:hypothetical protein
MIVRPTLGERVKHVHKHLLHLDGRKFIALLNVNGMSESTIMQWKSRPQYLGQLSNVLAIARACHISLDWLVGESEEMWSYKWRRVRNALGEWASSASKGGRLPLVWRKVQELHPEVREDTFAGYLGLVEFTKIQPGTAIYHISFDEWQNVRDGKAQPSEQTLRRAAYLTGLSVEWFNS